MSSITAWPLQAESWLDDRGRGAWIAVMVLGFVVFWPAGLAFLFYMLWSKRMQSSFHKSRKSWRHHNRKAVGSTGNVAFDSYKEETLKRLEDEQDAFHSFLDRLRAAKDKTEFDQFMNQRTDETSNGEDVSRDSQTDGQH